MRHTRIGALEVSVVALGTNNFGRSVDLESARGIVDAALEAGITFFDTSDNYGGGVAEGILGRALGRRRDDVVLATKFGSARPGVPGSGGASPSWVRQAVEHSLRELGTERIDLYYLHKPDPSTPLEATLEALEELVDAGKVGEIACSNLRADQIDEAAEVAVHGGMPPFRAVQVEYSLLHRAPETDGVLSACERHDLGLVPYYPLASGLLTGKQRPGRETGRLTLERYRRFLTQENYALVNDLQAYARERDRSLIELAIGWLLAHRRVPCVVVGASRAEQVLVNAAAADVVLNAEEVEDLDRLTRRQAA